MNEKGDEVGQVGLPSFVEYMGCTSPAPRLWPIRPCGVARL